MARARILIVDESGLSESIVSTLEDEGFDVQAAKTGSEALDLAAGQNVDFLITELSSSAIDGFQLISQMKTLHPGVIVFAASTSRDVATGLEAVRSGADDYLRKPLDAEAILFAVRKVQEKLRQSRQTPWARSEAQQGNVYSSIVAKSPEMHRIFNTIKKISEYKTTCLLMGESGTGKELIARAIHYNSSRAKKPFITVNCGAIPENLLESELFGHIKGAFTGAVRTKKGLFEEADSGTLFLDEIGELPLLLQVKLLRALQEEEIRRVGDVAPIKIDVRIVAATIKDLDKEVEKGTFREDLFYRLHVLPIHVPPLRDRKEDIPLLVDHFIDKCNRKLDMKVEGVDSKVMKVILDHDWPGNVRELENTIERAMVLTSGNKIIVENLPANLQKGERIGNGTIRMAPDELSIKKMSRMMEEELILKALQRCRGNRTKASKLLEISHRALLYKIKRYRLEDRIRTIENETAA